MSTAMIRTHAEVEQDYANRAETTVEAMHAAGIWSRKCRCAPGSEGITFGADVALSAIHAWPPITRDDLVRMLRTVVLVPEDDGRGATTSA